MRLKKRRMRRSGVVRRADWYAVAFLSAYHFVFNSDGTIRVSSLAGGIGMILCLREWYRALEMEGNIPWNRT